MKANSLRYAPQAVHDFQGLKPTARAYTCHIQTYMTEMRVFQNRSRNRVKNIKESAPKLNKIRKQINFETVIDISDKINYNTGQYGSKGALVTPGRLSFLFYRRRVCGTKLCKAESVVLVLSAMKQIQTAVWKERVCDRTFIV